MARLRAARVTVVGLGGVGSWAAEALARSAVGHLTLIDLDMVAESNTNRQLPALDGEYGKAKVDVMATRIRAINPACDVKTIEDFVSTENVAEMLPINEMDGILDAIDQVSVKAAMIAHCHRHKLAVVTAGAAGGQVDPSRLQVNDLALTTQDPLLSKVRQLLRRDFGFPAGISSSKQHGKVRKFGVPAVYSTEPLRYPTPTPLCESGSDRGPQGLSCAGFGSSVCVTASFGMAAAAQIIHALLATR